MIANSHVIKTDMPQAGQPAGRDHNMNDQIEQLHRALEEHQLYARIGTAASLRLFMERHVVCVWDFMSLLKSLQQDLTCVRLPWLPVDDPEAARLVNEIVLDEETDALDGGRYGSHFQWYLDAMTEVGCDKRPTDRLMLLLKSGWSLERALPASGLPEEACDFTRATFQLLERPLHVRAAVFFHAREDLVPRMFLRIVQGLRSQGLRCDTLIAYLERHIKTDRERHAPLAERLLGRLYFGDAARREEAVQAAIYALQARLRLWDAITVQLDPSVGPELALGRPKT